MNGIIECTLIIIIFGTTVVDPLKLIAGLGKSVNCIRIDIIRDRIVAILNGSLVDFHFLGLSP